MVSLVPMTDDERRAYIESVTEKFAVGGIRSGAWPDDQARPLAQRVVESLLRERPGSRSQLFFSVRDDATGETVGVVWATVQDTFAGREGAVLDLEIWERYRRRGYGGDVILLLEDIFRDAGAKRLRGQVFGHNKAMAALAERLGGVITSVEWVKDLSAGTPDSRPLPRG